MNSPLPQVVCPKCNLVQEYRKQTNCIHCGTRWTNWDIAVQLNQRICAGNTKLE